MTTIKTGTNMPAVQKQLEKLSRDLDELVRSEAFPCLSNSDDKVLAADVQDLKEAMETTHFTFDQFIEARALVRDLNNISFRGFFRKDGEKQHVTTPSPYHQRLAATLGWYADEIIELGRKRGFLDYMTPYSQR